AREKVVHVFGPDAGSFEREAAGSAQVMPLGTLRRALAPHGIGGDVVEVSRKVALSLVRPDDRGATGDAHRIKRDGEISDALCGSSRGDRCAHANSPK